MSSCCDCQLSENIIPRINWKCKLNNYDLVKRKKYNMNRLCICKKKKQIKILSSLYACTLQKKRENKKIRN